MRENCLLNAWKFSSLIHRQLRWRLHIFLVSWIRDFQHYLKQARGKIGRTKKLWSRGQDGETGGHPRARGRTRDAGNEISKGAIRELGMRERETSKSNLQWAWLRKGKRTDERTMDGISYNRERTLSLSSSLSFSHRSAIHVRLFAHLHVTLTKIPSREERRRRITADVRKTCLPVCLLCH